MKSKVNLAQRIIATIKNNPHGEAMSFLSSCSGTKFDWTTAEPISFPDSLIENYVENHPKNLEPILKVLSGLRRYPRQDNKVLSELEQSVTDYFARSGIEAQGRVMISDSIFNITPRIYEQLGLKENKQKILSITPCFGFYNMQAEDLGISTKNIRAKKELNWEVPQEVLDKELRDNPDIRILSIINPNNPTGQKITRKYALEIAEVLQSHPDVFVMSDEIMKDINLRQERESFSFGSLPEMANRTFTLNGIGKSRGIAGLRLSFACVPPPEIFTIPEIQSEDIPSIPAQKLASFLLQDNDLVREYLIYNSEQYLDRISHLKSQINELNKKLGCHFQEEDIAYIKPYIDNPEAGNVFLLDFSGLRGKSLHSQDIIESGLDVAKFMRDYVDTAVVPGECSYFNPEEMIVRINISNTREEVMEVFETMTKAIIENIHSPRSSANTPNIKQLSQNHTQR